MNQRTLEYVVALAQELNFTRAARRCGTSQSALSTQIARLEQDLGVQLFHRTSRSVRLSPAGAALLPRAEAILAETARARAELDTLAGHLAGQVRVGMFGGGFWSLPAFDAALSSFRVDHPGVDVVVSADGTSTSMADQVAAGDLDIAIVGLYADQAPAAVTHSLISDEPLVAVVGRAHPLAGGAAVDLAQLAAAGPFVDMVPGSGTRLQVDRAFAAVGVRRTTAFELTIPSGIARFVAMGFGAAFIGEEFLRPDLVTVPIEGPAPRQPLGLVHRPVQTVTPAVSALLGALRHEGVGPPAA